MNPCGVVANIKFVWHIGGDWVRDCILVGLRTTKQHRKNGLLCTAKQAAFKTNLAAASHLFYQSSRKKLSTEKFALLQR
jgi:hypothetical protein